MTCDVEDPITRKGYSRDPRFVAKKAIDHLRSTGLADTAYYGPEAEFFIFDDIRFDQNAHSGYYLIDSEEGVWNSGSEELPNLGYKPRHKEGYFPVPPTDKHHDLRSEMVVLLEQCGIEIECQHHEVGTGGQGEIDVKFQPMLEMADKQMLFKYIIKNAAYQAGKTVTFMPKPIYGDNGSGMHTHISLWKGNTNLFAGDGYAGMSEMAMHAIGGILKHAPALLAFTNPTTNSYKRLVPGLRSAGQAALLEPEPLGCGAHSDVFGQPEVEALRVPLPGPECQPVLRLCGVADGGA